VKRREFITLLGGAAASWPLAARAQQTAMPVIGFLSTRTHIDPHLLAGFNQGLKEAGYREGQNVAIEYRFAENQYGRLPALADDLVRRQVTVIAANGPAAATIPIVFAIGEDPIAAGLVANMNRPGGNLTGATTLGLELASKRLELLHEVLPLTNVMALLVNPTNVLTESLSKDVQAAARTLGVQLHVLHASSERDFDSVFQSVVRLRTGGLVIGGDAFFNSRSDQLAALALRHAVPAIYQYREFGAAGGLMCYGSSLPDLYRLLGVYSGRIIKGEKPADLPVQQAKGRADNKSQDR
jgi:putative ABC transport system substrate-binding protein